MLFLTSVTAFTFNMMTVSADRDDNYADEYQDKEPNYSFPIAHKKKNTGFILMVSPPDVTITPGNKAEYKIRVEYLGTPGHDGSMTYLTVRGVPIDAVGIFTPSMGIPTYDSKLTIVTHPDIEQGLYQLSIVAVNKKSVGKTEVALMVEGEADTNTITTTTSTISTTSVTTTTSTTTSDGGEEDGLNIAFSTDKLSYSVGESVLIEGIVTDPSQNAVPDAFVSIQVDDPLGSISHISQTSTDPQGFFNDTFTLPPDTVNGTYKAFVTATYQGLDGIAHSSFVVGESMTPAISIQSVNITATGETIEPGEEVLVSVHVLNPGSPLENGMIWLEVDDTNNVPVYITMISTTISDTITVEFHVILDDDAISGVYTANAYVSNGYISDGGVFLDKEQTIFYVESASEGPTDSFPSVSIVDPVEGQTVNETYRVLVNATDDNEVTLVEVSINGTSWINITANVDGGLYYYDWDTAGLTGGSYTVDARASDNATQTTNALQRTIEVEETGL